MVLATVVRSDPVIGPAIRMVRQLILWVGLRLTWMLLMPILVVLTLVNNWVRVLGVLGTAIMILVQVIFLVLRPLGTVWAFRCLLVRNWCSVLGLF